MGPNLASGVSLVPIPKEEGGVGGGQYNDHENNVSGVYRFHTSRRNKKIQQQ